VTTFRDKPLAEWSTADCLAWAADQANRTYPPHGKAVVKEIPHWLAEAIMRHNTGDGGRREHWLYEFVFGMAGVSHRANQAGWQKGYDDAAESFLRSKLQQPVVGGEGEQ
jgi:hypothetical protein